CLAQPVQHELGLADLTQPFLDRFRQRRSVERLAALRRQDVIGAMLGLHQRLEQIAMQTNDDELVGLLLANVNIAAIDVAPSHLADIAASLSRVEQKREGERELGGCAVEEALADARRPCVARLGLVTAPASPRRVASVAQPALREMPI